MAEQAATQGARGEAAADAATIAGRADRRFRRRSGVQGKGEVSLVDDEVSRESYTESAL
jgi:hypothetical protein